MTDKNSKLLVMSVPEAGAKLGLSRGGAYAAAERGEIPTIRIGKLLKVPRVAFDRMLERAGLSDSTPAETTSRPSEVA